MENRIDTNTLSKEQLQQIVAKQSEMIGEIQQQLRNQNVGNIFARLEFLFKILEFRDNFDKPYVEEVANEIKTLMTIKRDDSKSK